MAKSYHQILLPEKIELAGPLAEAYYNLLHGPTISYQNSPHAIGLIDLENELFGTGGWAEGDSYTGIKNIVGTKYDDVIKGNSQNNYLFGGDGNDRLFGGKGNDKLFGGKGDDFLNGNDGDDKLVGNGGADKLFGRAGADKLYGGVGADKLYGGKGNDELHGDEGADYLYGEGGDDKLYGSDGDDHLYGNDGNDNLYGGAGADIFVLDSPEKIFAQADKILDFTRGEDKIDVRTSLNDAAEVWVSREHKDNQTNMVIYENASKSVILGVLDNYSGDLGAQDFQDDVTVNEIL